MVTAIAACGGGGGGSSGVGGLIATGPSAPAAKLTTVVAINGAEASAASDGRYLVRPGDTVVITPSQGATWSTKAADPGFVQLRNPTAVDNQWSAQVVNTKAQQTTYTVTANAAGSDLSSEVVLAVMAGDARNGEFLVFATNGTQQKLSLNLDLSTYELTNSAGSTVTGTFSARAEEPGTFSFKSARVEIAVDNARFRLTDDVVVGSFPLELAQAGPFIAYSVQPFVAVRNLVTEQAGLEGTYNRFGIDLTPTGRDSTIRQVQVLPGGAAVLMCDDIGVRRIEACPPASVLTYDVTPGNSATSWRITNRANPNDVGAFAVARVGKENVYLAAGLNSQVANMSVFRIGLQDSAAWPYTTARGADTAAGWVKFVLDATTYSAAVTRYDGSQEALAYGLIGTGTAGPQGMRIANQGPGGLWAVQSGQLAVVVGGRGTAQKGFIQIGLTD